MPPDPYRRYCFAVEIEGLPVASFQSVTGLDTQIQMTEYREGTDPPHVRKLPGLTRIESNLVLTRGYTQENSLFWDWHKQIQQGQFEPRDGSIILCDEARVDRIRWEFGTGWISMLAGAELDAATSEVAVQRCEITYQTLDVQFLG